MWFALTGEKRSSYTYGENQELLVPASDLDVAAHRMFGDVVKLTHGSFGDFEITYTYDAEKKMYGVPVMADLFVYTPRVSDVTKEGEYYSLLVDYIPPGSAWTANFSGDTKEPAPDKSMSM
jgi:hypothetical protein